MITTGYSIFSSLLPVLPVFEVNTPKRKQFLASCCPWIWGPFAYAPTFRNRAPKCAPLCPRMLLDFTGRYRTLNKPLQREKQKIRKALNLTGFEFGTTNRNRTCI